MDRQSQSRYNTNGAIPLEINQKRFQQLRKITGISMSMFIYRKRLSLTLSLILSIRKSKFRELFDPKKRVFYCRRVFVAVGYLWLSETIVSLIYKNIIEKIYVDFRLFDSITIIKKKKKRTSL